MSTTVSFVVTGFMPFGGMATNPSQQVMRRLSSAAASALRTEVQQPLVVKTLEVSVDAVESALPEIFADVEKEEAEGGSGRCETVYLHVGVDASGRLSTQSAPFALERCARNRSDFSLPDERGTTLTDVPVSRTGNEDMTHVLLSDLSGEDLVEQLQARGWGDLMLSSDAGDFLCNYLYYRSLEHTCDVPSAHSFFLHVPPEDVVPVEEQARFVVDLINSIATCLVTGGGSSAAAATVAQTASAQAAAAAASVPAPGTMGSPVRQPQPLNRDDDGTESKMAGSSDGDGQDMDPAAPNAALLRAVLDAAADMGFSKDQALAAVDAGATTVPEAMAWILGDIDTFIPAGTSFPNFDEASAGPAYVAYKMVIVIPTDLEMSPGKIAAQSCHAAIKAYRDAAERKDTALDMWMAQGEATIVLEAPTGADLERLQANAVTANLPCHAIRDAGKTEVAAGSMTAIAIGPAAKQSIDRITGHLTTL